jgi:hypothetical protein
MALTIAVHSHLEVLDNHVCKTTRVKDFGQCLEHVFLQREGPGVDERQALVIDEELIGL